ncbi:DUF4806 domain-containing protein [Caenorhabditis elegans]|uniref:DUF4806 domain-containing protein n=1 Tax=Caenorhabditis elegans TaxID=6239 RepID=Q93900_CAEEL|nr:DUF4806 domain-containing protein [Caenorhabditis elegans]CAB01891.2 DUF4806 domain-containing protein [Caenorhabditis elegans]|eukprot:NP_001355363.1 Uncharacterized protein CELE_M163.5 [Caenorhabditis elegans]
MKEEAGYFKEPENEIEKARLQERAFAEISQWEYVRGSFHQCRKKSGNGMLENYKTELIYSPIKKPAYLLFDNINVGTVLTITDIPDRRNRITGIITTTSITEYTASVTVAVCSLRLEKSCKQLELIRGSMFSLQVDANFSNCNKKPTTAKLPFSVEYFIVENESDFIETFSNAMYASPDGSLYDADGFIAPLGPAKKKRKNAPIAANEQQNDVTFIKPPLNIEPLSSSILLPPILNSADNRAQEIESKPEKECQKPIPTSQSANYSSFNRHLNKNSTNSKPKSVHSESRDSSKQRSTTTNPVQKQVDLPKPKAVVQTPQCNFPKSRVTMKSEYSKDAITSVKIQDIKISDDLTTKHSSSNSPHKLAEASTSKSPSPISECSRRSSSSASTSKNLVVDKHNLAENLKSIVSQVGGSEYTSHVSLNKMFENKIVEMFHATMFSMDQIYQIETLKTKREVLTEDIEKWTILEFVAHVSMLIEVFTSEENFLHVMQNQTFVEALENFFVVIKRKSAEIVQRKQKYKSQLSRKRPFNKGFKHRSKEFGTTYNSRCNGNGVISRKF